MKRTLTTTLTTLLLCVCMVFGLAGCGTSQEEVDTTVSTAIAPISEQITAINSSIDDLKAVDTALDGYIDALGTKVTELEANDTATAEEITAIKATIETLKTKDTELEGKITTLENYVNTELSETADWAEATFATLAQYAEIQTEISNIKTTLTTLVDTTALSTAISTSENGMKEWVNTTLADGYYTIAEIDTKLSDLETKLNGADDTLEAAIEEQKTALATAKTELATAYTAAINEAIETNNGTINQKIATDIATAKSALQTQINGINAEIITIKTDITALNSAISTLQDKITELEGRINCLEGNHAFEVSYEWADDYTACTATQFCERTTCDVENQFTSTSIALSGVTLTAAFDGIANAEIDVSAIKNKDYIVATDENNNTTYVTYTESGLLAWNTYAQTNTATNLVLANDITLTLTVGASSNWTSVGTETTPYTGTVEGNGYSIAGLTINQTANNAGFIGYLKGGTIKNLTLEQLSVANTGNNTGGLVGYTTGSTIEFCRVESGAVNGTTNVGGLVGYQYSGKIVACSNGANVNGSYYLGGIVGRSDGNYIIGCYNTGTIQKLTSKWSSGGICGYSMHTQTKGCYNTASGGNYAIVGDSRTVTSYYFASNYWSSSHSDAMGRPTEGETENTGCTKIENTATAWATAVTAMNAELESYGFRYVVNTDTATSSTEPLIIEKITE